MFLYDKFCHVASNERWQKQGALFVYETIDTLTQLTTAGYFNRAKLDLNLGDLIFATIITEQESTTYETYALRVIGLNDDVIVEQANLSGGGSGGVTVHNDLTGRDAIGCHPISAITNLQSTLDGKASTANTYTKTEVDDKITESIGSIETALAEV